MKLSDQVTIVPILHGKSVFTREIRNLCLKEHFDCIAIDIPEFFQNDLCLAVEKLPIISAVVAKDHSDTVYYIPTDPCDATIEGIRQAFQHHIPVFCVGYPELSRPPVLPPLPDEYSSIKMGLDLYNTLCLQTIGNPEESSASDSAGLYLATRLHSLRTTYNKILVLVHFRNFVRTVHHYHKEKSHNLTFSAPPTYEIQVKTINPDHLYFALGELPFLTGKMEKERYDPFAEDFDIIDTIKDLFRETRDDYFDLQDEISTLSPVRLQAALTFLRNLTVMSGYLIPSLMDIIECAKGIGGNAYAIRILKSAKYYPYFPVENHSEIINIGINKVPVPDWGGTLDSINMFRDFDLQWRTISIKPDPSLELRKKFKFAWDPMGMCSHIPEDRKIENFNTRSFI